MGRALLVDATSVFAFQQYLKQHDYEVQGNINYGSLLDALRRLLADSGSPSGSASGARSRSVSGSGSGSRNHSVSGSASRSHSIGGSLPTPFEKMLAFVAINPEHEGQQKFCAYLRGQRFTVDETDFRDAFVLPNREFPYQRLSTRLTYVAGMLTAPYDKDGQGNLREREIPHLVVVTDAFDVYYPLLDYVQNRKGKAMIAFFRRGMEDRWQRAGLFDDDSPIKFCDLSDDAKAIVGADLASSLGAKEGGKGLASFKL